MGWASPTDEPLPYVARTRIYFERYAVQIAAPRTEMINDQMNAGMCQRF
jgi:hypothetical protein